MTFPILPSNSATGGYQVQRSLRFNSADSAYLNRTPSVAGNRKTWTWSGWVKRSALGETPLFGAGTASNPRGAIDFLPGADTLYFYDQTNNAFVATAAVFRDVSAWYHVVVAYDSTQSTNTNRVKLYVNGVQQTIGGSPTWPAQNYDSVFNNNITHQVGSYIVQAFFNGYMTEVNFIDGQALTPSSFGETNATTGQWQPKQYTGTYGTNGFYLNFSDNSGTTATTLGKDYSGNGNNWTPNNFSVTPGAGNDSMIDVPTNWADGGNGRGNYCTLNPLYGAPAPTNGNLDVAITNATVYGSASVTSGKWYWEILIVSVPQGAYIGIMNSTYIRTDVLWGTSNAMMYLETGNKYGPTGNQSYGATYTSGDILGFALDMDAGTFTAYKNGISQGVMFSSGVTGKEWRAAVCSGYTVSQNYTANFGQRPFAYTPPSGFKALNTQNIVAGTITTSGTFTGNVNADGPFVWLNGVPTAMTINGNAVTFGTHADKLSNGFKVRTSSTSYNNTGSNTYSITTTGARFKVANAQGNP